MARHKIRLDSRTCGTKIILEMAKDKFMAEETAVAVAWILTVVALLEAVSEGEATVEMNSENAVALQAVAEVVEASIIEIILTVATTEIRTITLASPQ
jgi:hypothetical protein